jgi:hypothetical protein
LLPSCKNDRAADPERPVFGESPEPSRARAPDKPSGTQQPENAPAQPTRSRAAEPEHRAGTKSAEEPKPFLRYEAPGRRVGDPGEIASREPALQIAPARASIPALIHRWAETILSRDLDSHMALYSEQSASLRRNKQALLARFSKVRRFEIHDLRVQHLPQSRATASFRVEWNAAPSEGYRFTLGQRNGEWKIQREERLGLVSKR